MHKIKVNVINPEVLERCVKRRFYVIWVVGVVPQLRRNKEFLAGNVSLLHSISDCLLRSIDASCVDVAVSCLERDSDGGLLSIHILPSSKSNSRDFGPSVERKGSPIMYPSDLVY